MKNYKIPLIFFIILAAGLVFSGCIHQDPEKESHNGSIAVQPTQVFHSPSPTPSPDIGITTSPVQGIVTMNVSGTPGSSNSSFGVVNYTGIRVLNQGDATDRMDDNRKKKIVDAALSDERVRALLQDEGVIEGVLYQCHPTPKSFSGPACAPALRILHENISWDFLVDEKSRTVIFVQHDLPPGVLI
jgi:hypothetical protein